MFNNNLFTLVNAQLQYTLQKNSRGGGIIGIALFLLIMVKWEDWFYPIANKLGLVKIAEESGIIQQTSVGTFFVVLAILFILLVMVTLVVFSGTILKVLFLILPKPIQAILILPFILVAMPFYALFGKLKNKHAAAPTKEDYMYKATLTEDEFFQYSAEQEQFDLYNRLKDENITYRRGKLYLQQFALEQGDLKQIPKEEAHIRLNRVVSSLDSSHNYVVGYTGKHDGGWYVLGTQPLPAYLSTVVAYFNGEYSMDHVKQALNSNHEKIRSLHVPAQPFYVCWDNQQKEYKVTMHRSSAKEYETKGSAQMHSFEDFSDFYYVNVGPFPNYYKSNSVRSMIDVIKKSHELAYLIPIYFDNEIDKYAEGKPNFITAANDISNYDTFGPLYMNMVEKKLRDLSDNGDITAFKAIQAIGNFPNN